MDVRTSFHLDPVIFGLSDPVIPNLVLISPDPEPVFFSLDPTYLFFYSGLRADPDEPGPVEHLSDPHHYFLKFLKFY